MNSKEKPILFDTEMVKAILEGRKTQTRRSVPEKMLEEYYDYDEYCDAVMPRDIPCTRSYEKLFFKARAQYQVGDILYVRETWLKMLIPDENGCIYSYKADEPAWDNPIWRPSIHMPREAARIFLKVTDVRVEGLQDITPADVLKEGIINSICERCIDFIGDCRPQRDVDMFCGNDEQLVEQFADLWDSIYAKRGYGWDSNPWVFVYEFERITN